jgi:hypothetical protein
MKIAQNLELLVQVSRVYLNELGQGVLDLTVKDYEAMALLNGVRVWKSLLTNGS